MAEKAIQMTPSAVALSRTQYYAVRSCNGLEGPAIYCSERDLRNVLDNNNNTNNGTGNKNAEWESFDCVAEAVNYITPPTTSTTTGQAHNKKRPAAHNDASQQQQQQQQPDRKRAATEQTVAKSTGLATMASAAATLSETGAATSDSSSAKITIVENPAKRPKLSLPASVPPPISISPTRAVGTSPKSATKKPAPTTTSTKVVKSTTRHAKSQQAFDRKCALLAKYKQIHGDCTHIPTIEATGEFKYLQRFVSDMKRRMKLFYLDATTSELTQADISKLEELGFNNVTIHRKRYVSLSYTVAYLETFDAMFEKLRQYQSTHGHCNVPYGKLCPEEDKELSRWVGRTRDQIKLFQKREPSALSANHVKQVLDLGFQLKPMHDRRRQGQELKNATFDERFLQLKAYKDKFGTLVVRQQGVEEYIKLRSWTMYIRDEYKRMREGQETILNGDRIDRLRGIGFAFQAPHVRQKFSIRAQEWLDFRTKHGRDPKQGDNRVLCDWSHRMRREATMLRQGLKSRYSVTQEQIDLLASWGFNFKTNFNPDAPKPVLKKWEARFEDLVEYQNQNGNCLVPQLHPGLGDWVKKQRQQYKLFRKGKKSILNQEKVEKLLSIGFVWQVRAARPRKPKNERDSGSESEDSFVEY